MHASRYSSYLCHFCTLHILAAHSCLRKTSDQVRMWRRPGERLDRSRLIIASVPISVSPKLNPIPHRFRPSRSVFSGRGSPARAESAVAIVAHISMDYELAERCKCVKR